jgi:hypothetical protein
LPENFTQQMLLQLPKYVEQVTHYHPHTLLLCVPFPQSMLLSLPVPYRSTPTAKVQSEAFTLGFTMLSNNTTVLGL